KDLSATGVHVDTIDGKLTLHGTVPNDAEKARAESAARKVDGVKLVKNLLQVVPPRAEQQVADSDDQSNARVEKALANDKRRDGSKIEVASVNKGVVLLEGDADSMTDYLEALNVTGKVAGVRSVESEVKSADRLTDAGTPSGAAPAARQAKAD